MSLGQPRLAVGKHLPETFHDIFHSNLGRRDNENVLLSLSKIFRQSHNVRGRKYDEEMASARRSPTRATRLLPLLQPRSAVKCNVEPPRGCPESSFPKEDMRTPEGCSYSLHFRWMSPKGVPLPPLFGEVCVGCLSTTQFRGGCSPYPWEARNPPWLEEAHSHRKGRPGPSLGREAVCLPGGGRTASSLKGCLRRTSPYHRQCGIKEVFPTRRVQNTGIGGGSSSPAQSPPQPRWTQAYRPPQSGHRSSFRLTVCVASEAS
jgi:hypothetical protein